MTSDADNEVTQTTKNPRFTLKTWVGIAFLCAVFVWVWVITLWVATFYFYETGKH